MFLHLCYYFDISYNSLPESFNPIPCPNLVLSTPSQVLNIFLRLLISSNLAMKSYKRGKMKNISVPGTHV